jgi:hypothetical protein
MTELLKKIRDDYLKCLRQSASEYLPKYEKSVCEPMFTDSSLETFVQKLFRLDMASFVDKVFDSLEINLDRPEQEPVQIPLESGLELEIRPCVWNNMVVLCKTFDASDPAFLAWFTKWMNTNDDNPMDQYGLYNVIHHTTVERIDGGCKVTVDFGSAELNALYELLSILQLQGNRRLVLESTELFD